MSQAYDLAVVGAGIVGLAHALAAARRGLRVAVFDRDAQANGASVRNFGFITVTGQQRGECWRRAMRSRDIWAEIAPKADIAIEHRGLVVAARRPEAAQVLEAFMATEMGERCRLLSAHQGRATYSFLQGDLSAVLVSPHELRVESRVAIPQLANWLKNALDVTLHYQTAVTAVGTKSIESTLGPVSAGAIVVAPGDDFRTLYSGPLAAYSLTRCKLHMLRVMDRRLAQLEVAVMSDLSLVRYLGYAELAPAAGLMERLQRERAVPLANGVHLIVVRSADRSLVVGDSHEYAATPDPFAPQSIDDLILAEYGAVFGGPPESVKERWIGTYASATDRLMLVDRPADRVRIVIVTSGTGASTAFAIGEEVVGELFD